MEIYLIRHTQTASQKGLCYGQTDVELADNFFDDAREILKKLPANPLVFSSPLSRCTRLAQLISNDAILDNRLLEMNFGDWENMPFAEIEAEKLQFWTENFVSFAPPKGESFSQLYLRVESFWHDLLALENEQVVIVTHAGVIRAILAKVLNLPLEKAFAFAVDFGRIHKLRYENNFTYIEFVNCL